MTGQTLTVVLLDSSLVALLETLDIAIHDTTDERGLNYNLVDHSLYRKILVSPDVRKFFQLCIEWIQVRSDGTRA